MSIPLFVTTIFGPKFLPFLAVHLRSVGQARPHASVLVQWDDLPEREIAALLLAFPNVRFERVNVETDDRIHHQVTRKIVTWRLACEQNPDTPLAMLDIDTLVVRPIDSLFASADWDMAFTWKDEAFPLNNGVMFFRSGRAGAVILREVERRMEAILAKPDSTTHAANTSGAADQHAMREIIGWSDYARDIVRTIDGHELVFRGVPCREFNETNCRPVADDLRIIHYKTGWHPILLEGKPWTTNRPQDKCRPMFEYFTGARTEAERSVARNAVFNAARAAHDRFKPIADTYEERGILNSEMLAACATAQALGADVVIESGRARGQSTRTLARYFQGTRTKIISVELERDADALYAESHLKEFAHVELIYGNAFKLLPGLLDRHANQRVALLMDGPKGLPAIELIERSFASHQNVVVAFLHDTRRQTPQRDHLESGGYRVFLTDDEDYVAAFKHLDRDCAPKVDQQITMHTWRPFMKGDDAIPSYGPTLAVMFPQPVKARAASTNVVQPARHA